MDTKLPRPPLSLIVLTQSFLLGLFLVGICALIFLPGISADVAESLPEYASLRTPLLVLAIVITALAMVCLGIISSLVQRIYRGTILVPSSILQVNILVVSLIGGGLIVIISFFVISNGQAGNPAIALAQLIATFGLGSLACVVLVLRSLLRQAILIRTELSEVI